MVVRHEKDGGMSRGWVRAIKEFSFRGDESVRITGDVYNFQNTPNATGLYTLNINFIFCEL